MQKTIRWKNPSLYIASECMEDFSKCRALPLVSFQLCPEPCHSSNTQQCSVHFPFPETAFLQVTLYRHQFQALFWGQQAHCLGKYPGTPVTVQGQRRQLRHKFPYSVYLCESQTQVKPLSCTISPSSLQAAPSTPSFGLRSQERCF